MDISARSTPSLRKAKARGGFSLIEVALAVGVLSFGLLATFGLVPVGMNTFHQAVDTSIGSQIVQHVVNDARQTDFSTLVSGSANGFRYFDYQGNETTPNPSIYQVNTVVTPQTTLHNSAAMSTLATVTVQIAANPGHQTIQIASTATTSGTNLWSDPRFNISTYTALVAKNK